VRVQAGANEGGLQVRGESSRHADAAMGRDALAGWKKSAKGDRLRGRPNIQALDLRSEKTFSLINQDCAKGSLFQKEIKGFATYFSSIQLLPRST